MCGQKFTYATKQSMTVTNLIFTTFMLPRHFTKNPITHIHDSRTRGTVETIVSVPTDLITHTDLQHTS